MATIGSRRWNIALCYESVLPARGGCETYIADLTRRLVTDGHAVHLYACRWDAAALPAELHYHRLHVSRGPRFLRPWRFSAACNAALSAAHHDVTVGLDKTWGQDVLYPQGGLHAASAEHNLRKHSSGSRRFLARLTKRFDLAAHSFLRLERKQYLGVNSPAIIVNSDMVRGHFQRHYGIPADRLHVVHSAIDPERFAATDRLRIRQEWRERWQLSADQPAAVFIAMNYRLKGLEPLLHAMARVPADNPLRLVVVGNPKTRAYERLAHKLGLAQRVRFHGFCAETRNAYFAADFLVHPTFYDPCSLVVLESLACGLPVITSRYNGASELLHPPDDGLVIDDPHDHAALANCLVRLAHPAIRSACAQKARQAALRWTFDDHYRKIMHVFAEVAARKQAA